MLFILQSCVCVWPCVWSCVWFLVGVWQQLADERDSVDLAPHLLWASERASVRACSPFNTVCSKRDCCTIILPCRSVYKKVQGHNGVALFFYLWTSSGGSNSSESKKSELSSRQKWERGVSFWWLVMCATCNQEILKTANFKRRTEVGSLQIGESTQDPGWDQQPWNRDNKWLLLPGHSTV